MEKIKCDRLIKFAHFIQSILWFKQALFDKLPFLTISF